MLHDSERSAQPQLVYTAIAEYEDLSERTHRTELTFEDPEHGKRAAAVRELNLPVTRTKVVAPRRPGTADERSRFLTKQERIGARVLGLEVARSG